MLRSAHVSGVWKQEPVVGEDTENLDYRIELMLTDRPDIVPAAMEVLGN
jgi:hypothetical protein